MFIVLEPIIGVSFFVLAVEVGVTGSRDFYAKALVVCPMVSCYVDVDDVFVHPCAGLSLEMSPCG